MTSGRVIEERSDEVSVEHRFIDNGQPRCSWIKYKGTQGRPLKPGDTVIRRQRIAQRLNQDVAKVTDTLQQLIYAEAVTWQQSVSSSICSHRKLMAPAKSERLIGEVKHS